MKRELKKGLGLAVLLALLTIGFAPRQAVSNEGAGRLEGTWNVELTIRNCQTGAPLATFPEVATFMVGGTMIDSTSARPQAAKTPGQGVWNHLAGNTYQFRFKNFNFDPATGAFTGWAIVTHALTLSEDANGYTSEGTAEIYNNTGGLVTTGCSTMAATRFE